MGNMVQYGVWSNCCNSCDFCLRSERIPYSKEKQLFWLNNIKENISTIDWVNQFSYGISLLGGELYYILDKDLQESFLELIDIVIEKVLKVSPNPECKFSTVTNGMYNPEFLYKVVDKIVDSVGIEKLDINFSYDLKYRFHSEDMRKLVLKNINEFHKKYNYRVGVQMILAQYVINLWKDGKFKVSEFIKENIPGNSLSFLYPHPTKAGKQLPDFFFNRKDFLDFIRDLKSDCYDTYLSFMFSTKNSCEFKFTGLRDRVAENFDANTKPVLSDGKEVLNPKCGHSTLYQCYTDSDKCVLCDLIRLDRGLFA